MPRKPPIEELSESAYWDARYSGNDPLTGAAEVESFDWFRSFEKIWPCLQRHLPPPEAKPTILHLGCGSSTATRNLHRLGYQRQTNVDFSSVLIAAMRAQHPPLSDTKWVRMDVRALSFPGAAFDAAIDKGTLDAMLHGSLWDPPHEVRRNVGDYVDGVARVLKPGGVWIYVTFRQPQFMRPLLERAESWRLEVEKLDDSAGMLEYFAYVMRRHSA